MNPPRQTPRNARFVIFMNLDDVVLTLRPGQSLCWHSSGLTDEGWSSETEEWRHEGTHLECTCIEDGQDCDGRLTVSKEFKAMLPGPDHTVRWHESKSEVYDQFAQAAGY